jgi:hypothetical protein
MAIDGEYPALEYLNIWRAEEDESTALMLPETFQAPHLRHLVLRSFALPIGSRLLTTAVGLVTLALLAGDPSSYFQPNFLLQWLSSMPQLEELMIDFFYRIHNSEIEIQLMNMPITTNVTLPNLRRFVFQGSSTYMETVIRWLITPRLERLRIQLEEPTFSVLHLRKFMETSENFRFDSAEFIFSSHQFFARLYLRKEAGVYAPEAPGVYALSLTVFSSPLNLQISSVAQIFNSPGQIFPTVRHLTLEYDESSEEHDDVYRTDLHKLLGSFSNVKTLCVDGGLAKELARCLREFPLELLPELQKLIYIGNSDVDFDVDTLKLFVGFIAARKISAALQRFDPDAS